MNAREPPSCSVPNDSSTAPEGQTSSKQQRFFLRQVVLPPLKRDHSRSLDIQTQQQKDRVDRAGERGQLKAMPESKEEREESLDKDEDRVGQHWRGQGNFEEGQIRPYSDEMDQISDFRKNSIEERRAKRKKLNLRENLSPHQLQMTPDFMSNPATTDFDNKVSGRWSREEHDKFIEAMSMFGKDWKKVEQHIGTRSGAQIRSHAQKFFNRIEKELGGNADAYIQQKAEAIRQKRGSSHEGQGQGEGSAQILARKGSLFPSQEGPAILQLARDRSISHTFGVMQGCAGASREQDMREGQQFQEQKSSNEGFLQLQHQQLQQQKCLPLQQVLMESFNSYKNPQEQPANNSKLEQNMYGLIFEQQRVTFESRMLDIHKEKQIIQNQLFTHFNTALSTPQNIQMYIDDLKRIHKDLASTYVSYKGTQANQLTKTAETLALSNMIELLNNIQILSQIQELLSFQMQQFHIKPNQQQHYPNSSSLQISQREVVHRLPLQFQQPKANENSADIHLIKHPAVQMPRARKFSDFLPCYDDRLSQTSNKHLEEGTSAFHPFRQKGISTEHNYSAFKKMYQSLAAGGQNAPRDSDLGGQLQRLTGVTGGAQEHSGQEEEKSFEKSGEFSEKRE